MKTTFTIILIGAYMAVAAQVPDNSPTPQNRSDRYKQNNSKKLEPPRTTSRPANTNTRQNDTSRNKPNSSGTTTRQDKSPFAQGIHAAPNAARTYDTLVSRRPAASTTVGTVIPGGNDTTFNANTLNPVDGVGTNSGAVDRSGQSQFGQTNWGRHNRNTVGESQWTIPPPITASFNREFPAENNATWTRNQVDTNQYNVRYRSGATWVTSSYDASGTRINMRTDIPLVQPPAGVAAFIAKQPATFKVESITKVQLQGRPEVYELRLENGKIAYVNYEGMEVKL